ncbi:MAG: flagellum-specific ATP synthase FliI, partial [Treponema sp.]|nr:flagellum-specific ATP synthase FliI [Treponema sp.]
VRGVLDGHIVLDRKLANAYHYPAIDVLASISRLSRRVTGKKTREACGMVRQWMATYQQNELMITTGAYAKGSSPAIDAAIEKHEEIEEFLKQEETDACPMKDTLDKLSALTGIQIPEEEYVDKPAVSIPTVAQVVDGRAAGTGGAD